MDLKNEYDVWGEKFAIKNYKNIIKNNLFGKEICFIFNVCQCNISMRTYDG